MDVLCVIVLGETDMEGIQHVKVHIYVGNTQVLGGPTRRTKGMSRHSIGSVNRLNQMTAHLLTNGPSIGA